MEVRAPFVKKDVKAVMMALIPTVQYVRKVIFSPEEPFAIPHVQHPCMGILFPIPVSLVIPNVTNVKMELAPAALHAIQVTFCHLGQTILAVSLCVPPSRIRASLNLANCVTRHDTLALVEVIKIVLVVTLAINLPYHRLRGQFLSAKKFVEMGSKLMNPLNVTMETLKMVMDAHPLAR